MTRLGISLTRIGLALSIGLSMLALGPVSARAAEPGATPRAAVSEYLDACRAGDYALAGRYLDTSGLPAEDADAARLARELKTVLDQRLWISLDQLSDEPGGNPGDELPEATDRIGSIKAKRGGVPVLLTGTGAEGGPRWRIAESTVARVPELWEEFGYGPLAEHLPERFFDVHFLEIYLWQWIGLIALAVAAWLVGLIAEAVLIRTAARLVERSESQLDDQLLRGVANPLLLTLSVAAFFGGSYALRLAAPAQRVISGIATVLVILGVTWLAFRVVNVVAASFDDRLAAAGEAGGRTMIQMGSRIVKAFLFVIAFLAGLQTLGFDVTTILAGLGIGGLAVALAAQKTFENFFGGISILLDRPIQVGEFCKYGESVGTVEEIGLRSTRVRSLDRTLVTVPNSEFSALQIENYAKRDRMRFVTTLGLRYETSAEQLRFVLIELKKLLLSHPRVTADPARIRFVAFGAFSLDLELFAYVDTRDWNEFLAIREDLLLRIMDVVESSGSGFAFPSSTVYLGKDDGLDEERRQAAMEEVKRQRDEKTLPLPNFPPERILELDDTLQYPPAGSAGAGS